jgi:hypothetical protein
MVIFKSKKGLVSSRQVADCAEIIGRLLTN